MFSIEFVITLDGKDRNDNFMNDIFERYKKIVHYLFFGACTTAINIICYYLAAYWFGFATVTSTIFAWIVAVIFAYLTNKLYVFESCSWRRNVIAKEVVSFLMCRIMTGILDIVIMYVCVTFGGLFDIGVKVFSDVLVIILNYIASKCIVFKKKN